MQDVRAHIANLARLPEGAPIVTLYLDAHWRDEHQRERVRLFFRERAKEAHALFSDFATGVPQTLARLERFVDELVNQDVLPDARGVMIVASEPRGLFEVLRIDVPFEPAMFVDTRPRLYPMIEASAMEKPVVIATVEARHVSFIELEAGFVVDEQDLERNVPARHKMGGWSQRVFQQHIKDHIRLVWQEGAKILDNLVRDDGVEWIVLFGQEPNVRGFAKEMPLALQERIVAMRPWVKDRAQLLEDAREALDEERVRREFELIHHVLRQGLADRSGTVGLEDTLRAMNERRVRVLALTKRFDARGYRCARCDALSQSSAGACPYCGGSTSLVSLREELVRRAVQQGADIVVTPEASPLNAYRGIGALLRHLSGEEHQRSRLGQSPAMSGELARSITT